MQQVISIIANQRTISEDYIVVVSALGGVTDALILLANKAMQADPSWTVLLEQLVVQHEQAVCDLIDPKQCQPVLQQVRQIFTQLQQSLDGIGLLGELSDRALDKVTGIGEQLSSTIINAALNDQQVDSQLLDARTLISTDENFGAANVLIDQSYQQICDFFAGKSSGFLVAGFIAATMDGISTTLGRGGSDYTAALLGAALNATSIEIWTDVDGVLTADPRKVRSAFPLANISYEEAAELAHFGAKVIYPKIMKPARLKQIPIQIKNTFQPQAKGTRISNAASASGFDIQGISSLADICLLRVRLSDDRNIGEMIAQIFDILSRAGIKILLTTQASHEPSFSIAVASDQAARAKKIVEDEFALALELQKMKPVTLLEQLSIIAIVGRQMKGVPGISGRLFSTLGKNQINVFAIAQGSSELNISAVIRSEDESPALRAIHREFFTPDLNKPNMFLVGTGLIGSALLGQIAEAGSPIRLCGVANSRTSAISRTGIALAQWQAELAAGETAKKRDFIDEMIRLDLANTVFVDCSSSDEITARYEAILAAGMAIATPNKKAMSGPYARYQKLQALAAKSPGCFVYETNVGAGLPILHALQCLIASNDRITAIEAVLSGTLSYIFNTFTDQDIAFSQVVAQAKELGFTEPDPRDDLNGMDVARKILILARETGLALELDDIQVEPLLPESCFASGSINSFFAELEKMDPHFTQQKQAAHAKGKRLAYLASLHQGKAKAGMQEIGPEHPFFNLTGSDNMISISSQRYCETPLVIKGPGAGAAVTASGLFANILTIPCKN
ncbi:Aspartokinase / Homoserine dehydrogenase [hydrothermal vent metagenome]|uniref:Aspartokinase / Homoserine dehydrogenase n=1 Tax=hydrothermal vent metagenome TaxID=652676 RepID=A0A3B0SJA8_9ZZZZ